MNLFNILATINIIESLFLIAYFLPIAFPPTVNDDIIELVNSVINIVEMLNLIDMFIASIAPTEPLTIPQISPITSLHILAIVLEFFISFTASLEPLIFLELFAWNDASFAVNTAVPIISNIIPIPINIIHNIINILILKSLMYY